MIFPDEFQRNIFEVMQPWQRAFKALFESFSTLFSFIPFLYQKGGFFHQETTDKRGNKLDFAATMWSWIMTQISNRRFHFVCLYALWQHLKSSFASRNMSSGVFHLWGNLWKIVGHLYVFLFRSQGRRCRKEMKRMKQVKRHQPRAENRIEQKEKKKSNRLWHRNVIFIVLCRRRWKMNMRM